MSLLIDLNPVTVCVLPIPGDLELHASWMPRCNASGLPEAAMGFPERPHRFPSLDYTPRCHALRHSDGVNQFVLRENGADRNLVPEEILAEIDLRRNIATVELGFQDYGILRDRGRLGGLRVNDSPDDRAVLLNPVDLCIHTAVGRIALTVSRKGLLLALVPVSVEAAAALLAEISRLCGCQDSQSCRGPHIADNANHNYARAFNDRDCIYDLLLVQPKARLVIPADDVGHSCFVPKKSH